MGLPQPIQSFVGNVLCRLTRPGSSTRAPGWWGGFGSCQSIVRYNDIVKPLLYALFFLEIPRLRLLPRVDPDFETLVPEGDIPAYCRWLVSRTPGNALFNFEEVIWQFGLDMRFFFPGLIQSFSYRASM